jgi:hypothetical protein
MRRLDWLVTNGFITTSTVKLDRPIFLLGNQGGGNTFLSRMIRRNSAVVSVGGGNDYWTSADEMQKVYSIYLSGDYKLSDKLMNQDPYNSKFPVPRSWSYGTNELYNSYWKTEMDFVPSKSRRFIKVIKKSLARYGREGQARFFDKSQVYTLRTRLIQRTLEGANPKFILMTRDPIISSYRAALGKAGDMARYSHLSLDQKVRFCAEHWNNCMNVCLNDSMHLESFYRLKFEDLIDSPTDQLQRICTFLEIPFELQMLPQENQKIPFATRYMDRWWPIRSDVNKQYGVPLKYSRVISEICGSTAHKLGYQMNLADYK